MISSDVSLGSPHSHQVPHIGRPQIEPVASARNVNQAPSGAAAAATACASFMRQIRPMPAEMAMTMYAIIDR